jgi:hypothetical protein
MPTSDAEHWLVWPGFKLFGTQDTLTEVMDVEDDVALKLAPLQPARINAPKRKRLNIALRSIVFHPLHIPKATKGVGRLLAHVSSITVTASVDPRLAYHFSEIEKQMKWSMMHHRYSADYSFPVSNSLKGTS